MNELLSDFIKKLMIKLDEKKMSIAEAQAQANLAKQAVNALLYESELTKNNLKE